jgi:tellurite resistance protein TehA-like permease
MSIHAAEHAVDQAPAGRSGALAWALGLNALFLVVELVGGIAFGSLALLADAGHLVADWPDLAPTVTLLTRLASTTVWGFGLWWLALAVVLLVRYVRNGGVPFHSGWWAFVFPLGAYTAATVTLARSWQSPVLEATSLVLYLGLLAAWVIVGIRTAAGLRSGRIWNQTRGDRLAAFGSSTSKEHPSWMAGRCTSY